LPALRAEVEASGHVEVSAEDRGVNTAYGFIPSPNSRWRYVGKPPGRGEIHRVIRADVHEVVTWSEPSPDENKPGHSWLGEADEFCKQFGPV